MIGKREELEKIPNCVFDPSTKTKPATVTAKAYGRPTGRAGGITPAISRFFLQLAPNCI